MADGIGLDAGMKPWLHSLICTATGLVGGVALTVYQVGAGALGTSTPIGPWTTGSDYGSAAASAKTRAIVARRGLLALPSSEVRYYYADTDDSGQQLDGRCRYRVSGGPLPTRWWSITLYDAVGFLVKNDPGIYSLESAALGPDEQARWNLVVAPDRQTGHWVPSGGIAHFNLTLRAYLPADGGRGNFVRNQLPAITREACA